MMALDGGGAAIAINELAVWAGSSNLIEPFDWRIMPGERWSLLGPNGCGKSTLLRTVSSAVVDASSGELSNKIYVNPRLRFGMLEQTAVSGSDLSVRDEVMSRMGTYQRAKAALEAAEVACVTGSEYELEALDAATSEFEAVGGYSVEKRVSLVLSGLGFEDDEFDRPCSSFSGGWQMRIGLARLLLSEPEILIMDEPTNHLDASARRWLADYISEYVGTVLVVSHDEAFVKVACNSIADVDGGRLQLYQSVPFDRYLAVREERRKNAFAIVEKQKKEEQRLLAVVSKWENVDRSKAAAALKALDKLWPEMEKAEALLVSKKRPPKLTLAKPPPCGIRPLALEAADIAHAVGAATILRNVGLEVRRGERIILRGPNGAGKSTLLKALSGSLPLAAGTRWEDERLRLGVFAQDLAQELPQGELALDYVASSVREFDPTITEERCRTIMGSLGLVGEKGTRRIGSLSGGEKARVALATFCLTPYNVLLLDEPTNHLDVDAIAALLDAIEGYEGSIVVISHDRAFCEALRATHVGYVCGGSCEIEERELRDSDFSEADRGVRNLGVAAGEAAAGEIAAGMPGGGAATGPPPPPPISPEEAKAQREAQRSAQKVAKSAPRKAERLEASIAEAEAALGELDAEMLRAGADVGRLGELAEERTAVQAKVDSWYAELDEIEAQRLRAAQMLEDAMSIGFREALPPPPAPPPPSPPPAAPSKKELAKAIKAQTTKEKEQRQATKQVKVSKKDREEYATIEAEVEELEIAAAEAHRKMEEGNAAKPRLPMNDLLALADAASASRRAADKRMERYIELEELMAKADA